MITLYGGRLQILCSRAGRSWMVRVILGPKPEHQLETDTGANRLQDARAQAQLIYHDAVQRIRPESAPPICWDCLQWDVRQRRCCLEFPEARQTGGRFAARCELFRSAIAPPWR